jgi:hypothetical protein
MVDQQFEQFVEAYPAGRRQKGFLVQQAFLAAVQKVGFERLMAAITQQKRSEQWENLSMIPSLRKWLEEERWIQVLPERRQKQRRVGERRRTGDDEPL